MTFPGDKPRTGADRYLVVRSIGEGGFGSVFKAQDMVTGRIVAIKRVEKKKLKLNEVHILKELRALNNPNIVAYLDDFSTTNCFNIVMEFCTGGNMYYYLYEHGRLGERKIQHFISQIAEGMKVLYKNCIIHRDLKLANILMMCETEKVAFTRRTLKIADFGVARCLNPAEMAKTLCGTYIAPEVNTGCYGPKVDLWNIGIMVLECIRGEIFQEVLYDTLIKVIPPSISAKLNNLVVRLIKLDPNERIDFEDFFIHPFYNIKPKNNRS